MICPGCNAPIDHLDVKEVIIRRGIIINDKNEHVIKKNLFRPFKVVTEVASLEEEEDEIETHEIRCPRCKRVLYNNDLETAMKDFQSFIDKEKDRKGG